MIVINEKLKSISESNVRESNFELLRILAMVFITAAHWSHGFAGIPYSDYTLFNLCFHHLFRGFGQVGVILYILISGYFLCKSNFKIQSFLRIALQIVFYSCVIIAADHIIFPSHKWTASRIVAYILLLSNGDFWFVGPYIVMFLLSPFLNIIIGKLNKKQFVILLAILAWFLSILYSVIGNQIWSNEKLENMLFFIFVYFIGAFIRLFDAETKDRKFVVVGCVFFVFLYALILVLPCALRIGFDFVAYFQARSNTLTIITAVFIFLAFKQMKVKPSKTINLIGASTFGIYLLHENCIARQHLWRVLLQVDAYRMSEWFMLYSILSVAFVFMVCSAIDIARKYLLEKPLFALIEKKLGKVLKQINSQLYFEKPSTYAQDVPFKYFWIHIMYLVAAIVMSILIPTNNFDLFVVEMAAYGAVWAIILLIAKKKTLAK